MNQKDPNISAENKKIKELEQELEIKNELLATLEAINEEYRMVSVHGQNERDQESLMLKELLDSFDESSSSDVEEFFSMISHELKTPLVPVQGYVKMLKDGHFGNLEEMQKEKLGIIDSNTNALVNLIQEMLDYQKLSKGMMEMNFNKNNIRKIIDDAILAFDSEFIQNKIKKEILLDKNLEFMCDGKRICQVISYLLDNSLKSVQPNSGTIRIEAFRSGDKINITIIDNGCGIPKEELEKVFKKFYQVDMSNTREKGGIGLGLTVCKMIVEAHKGKIYAESEVGKGSKFYLLLPEKL